MPTTQTAAPRATAKLRQRKAALRNRVNHSGTTVLSDFGRIIKNEPHKYIYKLKFYMTRHNVLAEPLKDFLRERYIESRRKTGARYEIRTYRAADGNRYVDYVLLEDLSPGEKMKLTLMFGDITQEKVVRDGAKRRPRLKKEEKEEFDEMIREFYAVVEAKRAAEREARGEEA